MTSASRPSTDTIEITVYKFDPSRDAQPRYETYRVPRTRHMRVLEALDHIVEIQGASLAYRWFCGVKRCGMCGMRINGKPRLACWEAVEDGMLIEPLANFPVVRDLVIDRGDFERKLMALQPWLQRTAPYPGLPEKLETASMMAAATASHCIECLLCVSACPAASDQFFGPAPLVQLARYAFDVRDGGERARSALEVAGIDNCVSCYQCSASCPMEIPVLEQVIGGLNEKIEGEGIAPRRTVRSWLIGHIHCLSQLASPFATLVNSAAEWQPARYLLDRFLKIDRRRPLPTLARMSFTRWFRGRQGVRNERRRVVLFHDTFMSYYEPEIGIAATELLEAAGYEVVLVEKRKCCGRPMLSERMKDEARRLAAHNIRELAPYAQQGLPIVGCEPSCLLTLKQEYPELCPTPEAQVVADKCVMLEDFIAQLADAGELDLQFTTESRKVVFHGHCHQRYFLGTAATKRALRLPANFQLAEIPATCCGMAGANGFEKEHYERSLRAAEVSVLPAVRSAPADAEIVACGVSCRQQIRHGAGRPARHPAVLLREALVLRKEQPDRR